MRGAPPAGSSQPAAIGAAVYDTAIGACGIVWTAGAICGAQLPARDAAATAALLKRLWPGVQQLGEADAPAHARAAMAGVRALLAGQADDLRWIALDMAGIPPFDAQVYALARAVVPGRTVTYGMLAAEAGDAGAARAVGQAMGHNRFAPIVPCHRVLAAGGREGGFSAPGGVDTKRRLLEIERARIGNEPTLF